MSDKLKPLIEAGDYILRGGLKYIPYDIVIEREAALQNKLNIEMDKALVWHREIETITKRNAELESAMRGISTWGSLESNANHEEVRKTMKIIADKALANKKEE